MGVPRLNKAVGEEQRDERELIARIRARDREAFSALYRRYQPVLHGYLLRLVGIRATAEEIVDDVMFVVWTDAARFRGDSRLSTWIFGIAYRKALHAMRREQRYRAPLDLHSDPERAEAAPRADHDDLEQALARLSPDHRQVVVLTYFGGFSYEEIARIAGCPVNTVKTRMYHARRRLRRYWPGGEHG